MNGYYIYYEKNEAMQAYMSGQKKGMGIEPEGILEDRAALRFRSVMQEKREHHAQKKAMTFLGTACVFLAMVILVIGVTLVNNYDRMSNMENEIYRISENLDHTEGDTELATAVEEENQEAIDNMDEKDAAEQDLAEESSSGQSDEPGDIARRISRYRYGRGTGSGSFVTGSAAAGTVYRENW